MKHIKLYNTTSAMNADLENLEAPYIAVAEDALGSPVIQGPGATTRRVYIEQSTYDDYISINASSTIYFVDYEPKITVLEEAAVIPWVITGSAPADNENYMAYFDVPEGTNITIRLPEGYSDMYIYDTTNGECISSSITIGSSDEGIVGTVGSNDLVLTQNIYPQE